MLWFTSIFKDVKDGSTSATSSSGFRRRLAEISSRLERRQGLLLLALFLLALTPRLFRIGEAPPGLNGDEVFNVIDAMRIGRHYLPLYMPGNNGREVLFFYLLASSLRLLGTTVLALRLPSALFGAGSALLAYVLGRDAFNGRTGLVAALLLSVSLWPVMISRIGLRAISLTFCTALTLYLMGRAMRRRSRRLWLLGGLALGLTMYTYIPSRLFPAVVLVWLAWVWFWHRRQWRANRRNVLFSLLLAALVFAPFGVYMASHPDQVNQRIYSMESALNRARGGEPQALLGSTAGVLRMFSIEGDEEWRYHLSGAPVFDPVTSLFFYLGLVICIWRALRRAAGHGGRPQYAMLLVWIGAMLAPNAVLNENPSFLRAAGAIVPVYLVTATGVDTALNWLGERGDAWRRAGPVLVGMGIVATLGMTLVNYFGTWVNHPQVRTVYNAQQAAMGRYLAQNAPPAETRVFVASSYIYDNTTPVAFSFFTDRVVTWFERERTFAWPSSAETVWYLIPAGSQLPDRVTGALDAAGSPEAVHYQDGELAFTLYQVPEGRAVMTPTQTARITFEQGPQLTGYDAPNTLYGGEDAPITLHWQIPPGVSHLPNELMFVRVDLVDASGQDRSRSEALFGYPQASWQEGDHFLQQMPLTVPQGIVPGPASLQFGLRRNDGRDLTVLEASVQAPRILLRSRPLRDFAMTPETIVFDETLALREASFRPYLTPGADLNVALHWVALRPPRQDYRLRLELARPGEEDPLLAQTFQMWPKLYPPTEWQRLEQVTTLHGLEVPIDIAADRALELRLVLLPKAGRGEEALPVSQGSASLGQLEPDDRQRVFEPPSLAHEVSARFGDSIRLLGYEIDTSQARPGGEVKLTLAWQALETPDDNYVVFNHLLGRDGRLRGQFDSAPVGAAWLTRTWLPGEVVVEERRIPIDRQAPEGPVKVIVGMYTLLDIQRLPVTVDGEGQSSDQLLLTEIEIR